MFAVNITPAKSPHSSRQLLFDTIIVNIGRSQDNDIILDSKRVSKHHAQITIIEDKLHIMDLGSANGIYVNNQRISSISKVISASDFIKVADYLLKISQNGMSTQVGQSSDDLDKSYKPTVASTRKLVRKVLALESDFDAFCLDFFPAIKQHFGQGMDRIAKETILLEAVNSMEIVEIIKLEHAMLYRSYRNILIYEQ